MMKILNQVPIDAPLQEALSCGRLRSQRGSAVMTSYRCVSCACALVCLRIGCANSLHAAAGCRKARPLGASRRRSGHGRRHFSDEVTRGLSSALSRRWWGKSQEGGAGIHASIPGLKSSRLQPLRHTAVLILINFREGVTHGCDRHHILCRAICNKKDSRFVSGVRCRDFGCCPFPCRIQRDTCGWPRAV